MKMKLKEIKPNPFRKEINGGKIDEGKVLQIVTNFDEKKLGGLANSLPVVKRNNETVLVFGHKRIAALKKKFGDNYEVEITIQKYNDDQLFRGMIIENLTKKGEFDEEEQSVGAIYRYLQKNQDVLKTVRESRTVTSRGVKFKDKSMKHNPEYKNEPTAMDISQWLDDNTEKVMKHDVITRYLNIYKYLDKDLKKTVEKKHDNSKADREDGKTLNSTQAGYLATEDFSKAEQKVLAKALLKSKENRVRTQGELISKYKKLKKKEKKTNAEKKFIKDLNEGKADIADIVYPMVDVNTKYNQTVGEKFIELREAFKKLSEFLEDMQKQNNDKRYLERATSTELIETYQYLWAWTKEDYVPFVNKLILELRKKKSDKGIVSFNFKSD